MTTPKSTRQKCACGCGQAPASTTRLRKSSCPCGQSIVRLSRAALATVNASCIACGGALAPDCLFDRAVSHDAADASAAVAVLESRADGAASRAARAELGASHRETGSRHRCGDCGAIRAAHGPCGSCRSERDPVTTFMHPRAARAVGGDMPFSAF